MKKKRVALHICILLLAVVCMCAGVYVGYWETKGYNDDLESQYNYTYISDVQQVLRYGYAQSEIREKFGDANKVLIEDEELGNVTVSNIWEIFADKYAYFYENRDNFECFESYEDSLAWDSIDSSVGTMYEEDQSLMKAYKKKWSKNTKDTDAHRKYNYYKSKCDYVDEYVSLASILSDGLEEEKSIYSYDAESLAENTCPVINSGAMYYMQYSLGDERYIVSNVPNYSALSRNEINALFLEDDLIDATYKGQGVLVQDEPLYDGKDFESEINNLEKYLEKADVFYMAVDASNTSSFYYRGIEDIEQQPTAAEQKEIKQNEQICIVVMVVALVIAFIIYILLMFMAGHKEKGDEPKLCSRDKFWWDVEFVIVFFIFAIMYCAPIFLWENSYSKISVICIGIISLPAIEYVILSSESLVRRFKTKSFMKTTLLGKICALIRVLFKKAKVCGQKLYENIGLAKKIIVAGVVLSFVQIIAVYVAYEYVDFALIEIVTLFTIAIIWTVCYLAWRYFNENKSIIEGAQKIADGDIDFKIEDEMKFGVNNRLKDSINGIGDGLSAAIEKSIKNERMKTDLIANVSHDLKTPLTSIINYVDLLKTDGLDSEKAEQYLDVLDKKSQRLKHLTEDLVEVSKLNSGVAKLEMEKLDIVQLVNQSLGEYDEKFAKKKLQIIKIVQEEPIYVMADGRKTWRLFENLYENVYKYAMPGTRVYVDVKKECGKVVIAIKNISENPLNFSADELTERFVRGDQSRTTEGSGLGLSIASSIMERQNGKMKIVLDGDLFKVEAVLDVVKSE